LSRPDKLMTSSSSQTAASPDHTRRLGWIN
jgi:hypothetical protein